ncbi:MAG: glycosyltransferase family 39 protein [Chloroflexota bacterium]|nr:glycosyltransferase family 39 protein [Chloroflexota bacterium]MDQ5866943.1 glycosyltransferase family 39 protein [Chloroflexota bacterium]
MILDKPQGRTAVNTPRAWQTALARVWVPSRLVWLVVLLAAGLRLYRYDALSLWLDEGSTVLFARLPWPNVLGLHGPYDAHPPLYYALVKLFTVVFPEVAAGRLLSVFAGTLTVPLVYALASRLSDRWTGLMSALVLAANPVHIWYSQEARQYAVNVLLVGLSYLALVAFHQTRSKWWSLGYGASLLAAMYVEYSAIYALAPQVIVLAYVVWKHRKRALPLLLAGAAAVVGYLPWLPWMLQISAVVSQQGQYVVNPTKVLIVTLGVAGIAGNSAPLGPDYGGYFWGIKYTAWELVPAAQPAILAIAASVLVAGAWRLSRQSAMSFLAPVCLLATILAAILFSLYRPGFIDRTVIYAVLGWSIAVGAAAMLGKPRTWLRVAAVAGVVLLLGFSAVSLRAIYLGALKQQWRELAAEAVGQSQGKLLVTYPTLAGVLIDAYEPEVHSGNYLNISDGGDMPDLGQSGGTRPDEVWLAYMEVLFIQKIRDQLQAQGYEQVSHKYFAAPLFLDHYRLTDTSPPP